MKQGGSTSGGQSFVTVWVTVESLIENESPIEGARLRSLSCTMTSKRHDGDVVLHMLGNIDGEPEVSR
jgi:hypothetical protein